MADNHIQLCFIVIASVSQLMESSFTGGCLLYFNIFIINKLLYYPCNIGGMSRERSVTHCGLDINLGQQWFR